MHKYIRWIARIWGLLLLAFISFFLLAHVFGDEEPSTAFQNQREVISFLCFPVSTIAGLILAWKWERAGGWIIVAGMAALLVIRTDLVSQPIFVLGMVMPGILFIISAYLRKNKQGTE